MKMDEEWPDHFEERLASVAAREIEEEASASTTRWPTWSPGRSRCKIICTTSWAGSSSSPSCGRWPTGSSTTSTPTAICRAGWKTCSSPTPADEQLALAQRALAVVQKLDPPGVGARDLRECLLLQLMPGMPYYEQLRDADLQPPGRPGAQPPAGHRAADRLLDRADPGGAGRAAEAESQAGRRFQRRLRPAGHARRVRRAGRGRQVPGAAGRRPHAEPVHQPLLSQAVRMSGDDQRRDPRIHQAQDQLGPVADRLDRAAPQHADARGPGDRRSSDRVPEQGPRGIEPLKMQQIADKVGVHVTTVSRAVDDKWIQTPRGIFPAQAILLRRHGQRRRRGSGLGHRAAEAAGDHRRRRQAASLERRRAGQGTGRSTA